MKKLLAYSLISAVLLTLLTGLAPNNMGLLGVGYWGYFLPWLSKVVYPDAPYAINWLYFFIDVGIWFGISFAVIKLVLKK